MIQQNYKNSVESTSEGVTTTGFSIEVNESMFEMLTAKVYNDPTLAVVREWSTNACDACIAANLSINYDVHLPTPEEPTFSVRDYGTGLAPEDIVGLFSNLGASTKRDSDAFNGTLGIGRMAGLAVSDSFTVESFYEGKLYTYVVSMQKGVPVTMHLGETPTTEPNGLCLSVTVEQEDIRAYESKALKLYPYFDHKPNLNLDINLEIEVDENFSDEWFFAKETPGASNYDRTNYVVMSQVAYAVPHDEKVKNFGFHNLVIKAPPGAVTFNPGRESLSLNKSTIEYLNRRYEEIKNEYATAVLVRYAEAENDKDLFKAYNYAKTKAPSGIEDEIDYLPFASDTFKSLVDTRQSSYMGCLLNATPAFAATTNNLLMLAHKSSHRITTKAIDSNNKIYASAFLDSEHVIVDVKTKFKSPITTHYSGKSVVLWQRDTGVDIEAAVEEAKKALDDMGIPYTLVSSIVGMYTGDTTKKAARMEALYTSQVAGDRFLKSELHSLNSAENAQYLCVKLNNTTPILKDSAVDFEEYMTVYKFLRGIVNMPIIRGVAKKYQSYVEDLDNWHDFEDFIKKELASLTFRRQAPYAVPSTYSGLINQDNVSKYPKAIQDYYLELKGYKDYMSGPYYVDNSYTANAITRLGGTFVPYEPCYDVDMEVIDTYYATTKTLLTNRGVDEATAIRVANLEHYYETHNAK